MNSKETLVQISELNRLYSSTKDEKRKQALKLQIQDLEELDTVAPLDFSNFQQSTKRPMSARPLRFNNLTSVSEDAPKVSREMSEAEGLSSEIQYMTSSSNGGFGELKDITVGNRGVCWMSTGLYPQCIVVKFTSRIYLSSIKIGSENIKALHVELLSSGRNFVEQQVKIEAIGRVENVVTFEGESGDTLVLTVVSGHGPFSTIHKLFISGDSE